MSTDSPRLHPDIPEDAAVPRVPAWYVDRTAARERFGEAVDSFGPFLMRGDPPADELVAVLNELRPAQANRMLQQALDEGIASVRRPPRAFVQFFRQIDEIPLWLDWDKLDRGGRAILRTGPLGAVVLACYSLPLSYASPDGSKPLTASGRLVQRASRRLTETARFLVETCRPGGLRRGAEGFKITIRVRLMHAQVRRLLLQRKSWPYERWGLPVNQAYMAGTNVLFSSVLIEGLSKLGYEVPQAERDDIVQLWRYGGLLSGVDSKICAATEAEGLRLIRLIHAVMDPPDDDSRALVKALMEAPLELAKNPAQRAVAQRLVDLLYGLSRHLVGEPLADALAYPRTSWRHVTPLLRGMNMMMNTVERRVPESRDAMYRFGLEAWERVIENGLAGIPAAFDFRKATVGDGGPTHAP
ncbi:oxygenase MpaB family protein [Polyangium sp. 15x6]|uniref:oxygenase MpaB family protein n=1 Tax=Polyangium sp. 15x6 TaxID=3042687 RepID=UPI00249CE5DE|nr:oxygenase MpaB family protein [Polyangium sp. 15x6]MDI3290748.1 oxygenase MpaB family protein [Polyangium sp. 15x6]